MRMTTTLAVLWFIAIGSNAQSDHLIDSLDEIIDVIDYDVQLTWDQKISSLASIGDSVASRYGSRSRAFAHVVHRKGVFEYIYGIEGVRTSFRRARESFEEALAIRMSYLEEADSLLFINILNGMNNIGICQIELSMKYEALETLKRSVSFVERYRENIYPPDVLLLYLQLARAYADIGDFDNALLYFERLRGEAEDLSERHDIAQSYSFRAAIESSIYRIFHMGDIQTPLHLLDVTVNALSCDSREFCALLANALHNLAFVHKEHADYNEAMQFCKEAVNINRQIEENQSLAANYQLLGILYRLNGNFASSEDALRKSQSLFRDLQDSLRMVMVSDDFGDLFFDRHMFEQSLEHDDFVLDYLMQRGGSQLGFQDKVGEEAILPDKDLILTSLESKSTTLLKLYEIEGDPKYLHSAYEHLKLADEVIDRMRGEFIADASKVSLVDRAKPVYEKALEVCWELYQLQPADSILTQAFEFAEKSKAIILQEAVRTTRAKSTIDPELAALEKDYNLKANYYEKQVALNRGEGSPGDANYLDSLLLYRRKREVVVAQIREQHPDYYGFIFDRATRSPAEVQRALAPDQALIEYFVGDSTLYAFTATSDSVIFTRAAIDFDRQAWGKTFTESIVQQDTAFMATSHQMYQRLIAPIEDIITLPERLIIVPDDVISTIAFDALITKPPPEGRFSFAAFKDYLIHDHQISYAFSATTLLERPAPQEEPVRSFLGIAPQFAKGIEIGDAYFQQLEGNVEQVEEVSSHFPQREILSGNTSSAVLYSEAGQYDILHFATHAKADVEDGNLSYILLGPADSSKLYVNDLYAYDLNAEMTVLSACQTGAGPIYRGEGVISLARGFAYAGSVAVITSLWNVREDANESLIQRFYEGLDSGLPKDEALRRAKLSFLASASGEHSALAHPYYWAPMICIGDPRPYRIASFPWLFLVLGAASVVIGAVVWQLRLRNQS